MTTSSQSTQVISLQWKTIQGQLIQQLPKKWHRPEPFPKKNKTTPPSNYISLCCKARCEIGFLQVPPLRTTQLLPCGCWDVPTAGKIQWHQVAALQTAHDFCRRCFVAEIHRQEADQMVEGGGLENEGTLGVDEFLESIQGEVACVNWNAMIAQRSHHSFGHLTTACDWSETYTSLGPSKTFQLRQLHSPTAAPVNLLTWRPPRRKTEKWNHLLHLWFRKRPIRSGSEN